MYPLLNGTAVLWTVCHVPYLYKVCYSDGSDITE